MSGKPLPEAGRHAHSFPSLIAIVTIFSGKCSGPRELGEGDNNSSLDPLQKIISRSRLTIQIFLRRVLPLKSTTAEVEGLSQPIMGSDVIQTGLKIRTSLTHPTPIQGSLLGTRPPKKKHWWTSIVTSNSTVSKWGPPRFPLTCRMLLRRPQDRAVIREQWRQ